MRHIAAALAFSLCLAAGYTRAQDQGPTPAAGTAIRQVIEAQLDAFRHEDGVAALGFATPALQEKFGDGPHFLAMVRTAYPAVYRPRSVTFGALAPEAEGLRQTVEVVGEDGRVATALYDMRRQADGTWRIAGCTLVQSERTDI